MRKFMSRAIVTLVIGAMLTGNASAVSAKELYDARHVCTDVEAGGLDAAVQDAVKQKVIEYNAKDLKVVTRWGAEDATDEEGNYKVTFSKQYSQIFYCIPAEFPEYRDFRNDLSECGFSAPESGCTPSMPRRNSAGGRTAPDRRTASAGSLPFSGSSDLPGRTLFNEAVCRA